MYTKLCLNYIVFLFLGPVVQRVDSAIHRIVTFSNFPELLIYWYKPDLSSNVSLGTQCKVDLKKFHGLGTSKQNPATSCKQIHDIALKDGKLLNGVYWIKTSADRSVQTYCDLANGGWTLVGKVSGFVDKMYTFWLIKNYHVDVMNSPALPRYTQ